MALPARPGSWRRPRSSLRYRDAVVRLLDVQPNGGIPLGRDQLLGRVELVEGREDRALDVRQLRQLVRRHGIRVDEVLVADRVAVARQPEVLALVAVEVLHPELGRVRVWRVGADRLDVDTGEAAAGRDDDGDLGPATPGGGGTGR